MGMLIDCGFSNIDALSKLISVTGESDRPFSYLGSNVEKGQSFRIMRCPTPGC